jgi:hypothetical protein
MFRLIYDYVSFERVSVRLIQSFLCLCDCSYPMVTSKYFLLHLICVTTLIVSLIVRYINVYFLFEFSNDTVQYYIIGQNRQKLSIPDRWDKAIMWKS